ncbi:UTP-glucose-1-phosphate uridylyltransferase [Neisseria shayeganii 871]|uniref:UTP-glucose-1-phosphate uridylyltransferase n=1 Tax=Neisseria shayeganii 871 TaxID=1032488 RepID=G4CJ52_9NEIS|nr:UTP-glucose-1-phosphate uridylyltransferase [Neisseria shayeganii 871]
MKLKDGLALLSRFQSAAHGRLRVETADMAEIMGYGLSAAHGRLRVETEINISHP